MAACWRSNSLCPSPCPSNSVLPSSVATMAFCGGQQERREEEKDAEQVCLNWEDEVCILL